DVLNGNYKQLSTLRELFYGVEDLNEENLQHMDIYLIHPENDDNYYKVILVAKSGYSFERQASSVESGQFTLV
ncbi:MAG: hypothetical protein ACRC63_02965, partial [Metamycoplasmataceae bacterium]